MEDDGRTRLYVHRTDSNPPLACPAVRGCPPQLSLKEAKDIGRHVQERWDLCFTNAMLGTPALGSNVITWRRGDPRPPKIQPYKLRWRFARAHHNPIPPGLAPGRTEILVPNDPAIDPFTYLITTVDQITGTSGWTIITS